MTLARTLFCLGVVQLAVTQLTACSLISRRSDNPNTDRSSDESAAVTSAPQPAAQKQQQISEMELKMSQLTNRLEAMEAKLSALSDKVDYARASSEASKLAQGHSTTPGVAVTSPAADLAGEALGASRAAHDPESGFSSDAATQDFRRAKALFDSAKYPESVLDFTGFLQKYADHALAGSAQYYIAEAYYQQKEYRLALTEYQRVLTSYDRSPRVPETLGRMATIEQILKMPEASAKHLQTLTSMYPHSPAAAHVMDAAPRVEAPAVRESAPHEDAPPTAPVPAPKSALPATEEAE